MVQTCSFKVQAENKASPLASPPMHPSIISSTVGIVKQQGNDIILNAYIVIIHVGCCSFIDPAMHAHYVGRASERKCDLGVGVGVSACVCRLITHSI